MKKLYIFGMAAVLGLGLTMQSCGDDEGLTKEDVEEAVKASNALSAEEVAAIIAENTLTEEQIKQLIEENKLTEEELEAAILEAQKITIDREYHEVGVDTLRDYYDIFRMEKQGPEAYITLTGATDNNLGYVLNIFVNGETMVHLDLSKCKLESPHCYMTDYYTYAISEIIFPEGLKELKSWFAYENTTLTSVTFNKGIETLEESVFEGCPNLKSATLPEGLKTINEYCFYRCGLTTIEIPASIKVIGDNAFGSCGNLESVTFLSTSKENLYISSSAFNNCSSDMKIYVQNEEIGKYLKGVNSGWNVYCGETEITSSTSK